jgi:putative ABC transport system substrate-binding protein
VKRRSVITLLGGAAAWPLTARAQRPAKVSRIGFVAGGGRPPSLESSPYAGFAEGMRELGYIEGKHFIIDYRFAEGQYERFRAIAAEFARLGVDIILVGAAFAVPAMREANPSTPIVLGYSIDPVGQGHVASLARPGGNTTGLSSALHEIVAKQVDLLLTTVPNLRRLAVLYNPEGSYALSFKTIEATAQQAGIGLRPTPASSPQEIEATFDALGGERVDAVIGLADALFATRRQRIAQLMLRARLPSIFSAREYTEAGALMSYGDSLQEFYRRAASFVDKIIKGAKPGDLPVEQPTKFQFVVNRKSAEALGIVIPANLYIFADEVIE